MSTVLLASSSLLVARSTSEACLSHQGGLLGGVSELVEARLNKFGQEGAARGGLIHVAAELAEFLSGAFSLFGIIEVVRANVFAVGL